MRPEDEFQVDLACQFFTCGSDMAVIAGVVRRPAPSLTCGNRALFHNEVSITSRALPYPSRDHTRQRHMPGGVMPYLCRVTISGPEPDAAGVTQMMDALSSAIEAGWEAPWVVTDEEQEAGPPDDPSDDDSPDGAILDYRVFGYPGGAFIVVVLDGGDLMQTSMAVTSLARHLTTWSPGLLEYSPDEVRISKIDRPYDGENWLPLVDDGQEESGSERPRWHLAELLDDDLLEMAAGYLLARAVRSLWDPADSVESHRARDIVLGSVEVPWGRELVGALGVLLIRTARLEAESGSFASLVIQGAGDPDLAADLLRRARETGPESETDGWDEDNMRGHVLVEGFMEDHQLLWNRVLDDESAAESADRCDRQLKILLWAGLRVLATTADTLRGTSGPWQLLDALGDDEAVSVLAQAEEEDEEESGEHDEGEIDSAATALVLIWLSIHHPELLDTPAVGLLVERVTEDVAAFHQVFHATMIMAGPGPLNAALAERPAPSWLYEDMQAFAAALAATDGDGSEGAGDPYNDMHGTLDEVLDKDSDLDEVVRYLLAITGVAAKLASSDTNPNRGREKYVSEPRMLTHYLLVEPAMHACIIIHRHDDDSAVRTRMLSLAAQVAPIAARDLVAEFPGHTGDDPRLESAARARTRHWIGSALQVAGNEGNGVAADADLACTADARTLARAVIAGLDMPIDWPTSRLVSAGAEAASAILHSAEVVEFAEDVFAESRRP